MAKTEKRNDTVQTGTFTKTVRIPIDAEETEKREIKSAKIQLKIRKIQAKIRPEQQEITKLRSEHRKLLEDIELGTTEQEAKVYEVKNYKRQEAVIYLADTKEEVGRRTLEKIDYQTDVQDQPAADEA
jgi:hypothetical protein